MKLTRNIFLIGLLLSSILFTIVGFSDLDNRPPPVYQLPYPIASAAAEEEEEEEEEEESTKDGDKEEEEEEEGKEESKEGEEEQQEEPKEETQEASPTTGAETQIDDVLNNLNQEAATVIQGQQAVDQQQTEVKNQLNELLNPQLPPLLANLTEDHTTNATPPNQCNCTLIKQNTTTPPPLPTAPAVQQPSQQLEQIILSSRINDYKVVGGAVTDPAYTNAFSPNHVFDNLIDKDSYWSQSGKAGFIATLDKPLSEYEVCSAQLTVYQPKNVPFTLKLGTQLTYNGVIDSKSKDIVFDQCVRNVDTISMAFDAGNDFTSLAELKLFGKKISITPPPVAVTAPVQQEVIPELEPTIPQTQGTGKTITIEDSTAEIDIKNSTVTFKFDPLTATFVGQPTS